MNPQSARSFVLCSLILGAVHFAVAWLFGFYLFSQFGFSHSPARKLYEAALGTGVVYLGLPDTVLGWLCNSLLYGIFAVALVSLAHFCSKGKLKLRPSKNAQRPGVS
jgi:hypothetical protein